jgi:quinol monooxygenase YgiN
MLVLAVTWQANPGKESEVARLFQILQVESRKEPGCLLYLVQRHCDNPRLFFVYEQYQDDAALDAHRATPHFQQYARGELPKVAERIAADLYEPL